MIRFTLNLPDSYGPRLNARLKSTGHKKVAYVRWLIARDIGLATDETSRDLPDPHAMTQRAKQALRDSR